MAAGQYNLYIEQGATLRRVFVMRDPVTLLPLDLTGCIARMQIRKTKADTTTLASYDTTNTKLKIPNPSDGRIELLVHANETKDYPGGYTGVYDLEVEYPDTQVDRILEGTVCVSGEVTK